MRKVIYSPQAAKDLFLLRSTKEERQSIKEQARLLAADPSLGFPILFEDPFADPDDKPYRYEVGRFKLNYIFDADRLEIVSVMQ